MVDAADHEKVETAKQELQGLLAKPQLSGIPVSNTLAHLFRQLLIIFRRLYI